MKHLMIYYNLILDKKKYNYFIWTVTVFLLSIRSQKVIKALKNLEDLFHFCHLDENVELLSNENKKVVGKFKIETPKNIYIDDFFILRSKMYAFKCGDDI